ncbi:MAG: ArsR family transcriptional regulator [Anaerolineae bacterium]|nr:winged helix-turn-helix transcriptional regulator [Anaerolineales bacterium]MCQ3973733.1 ArsR family transcriptional regulator [Anaerolineae bacterium]
MDKFSALADPTRRLILEMLAREGQLSATEISDNFQATPSAISQHLKVLREANLILMEKRAQQRLYQINPQAVDELEQWVKQLTRQWEERFAALDQLLEAEKKKILEEKERTEDQ